MDTTALVMLFLSLVVALCVALSEWARNARDVREWREAYADALRLLPRNANARLLGQTVEAKVYEASDWRQMVIVAVSWKGAVAVRPIDEPEACAKWIRKDLVAERVRDVD
jgi:Flp pilus assembly protein TadG